MACAAFLSKGLTYATKGGRPPLDPLPYLFPRKESKQRKEAKKSGVMVCATFLQKGLAYAANGSLPPLDPQKTIELPGSLLYKEIK